MRDDRRSGSDEVEVTTLVAADAELAFAVFTEEIDLWWRHGPRHRTQGERSGTRVTIVHRGWDRVPAGHRARNGLVGPAFAALVGLWWGDLLTTLQARVQGARACGGVIPSPAS